jgi:hypothetical protein
MGAKITIVQGVVPCWVKNRTLYVKDMLGKVHKGSIDLDMTFEKDSRPYVNNVFVNMVKGDTQLVCRYDKTFSIYRNETKELLDIGIFDLEDLSILKTDYKEIGYLRYGSLIHSLVLDMNNKMLVHAIRSYTSQAIYSFRFRKPFEAAVDIQRATVESHREANISKFELYIYTPDGVIDWRRSLIEIPRTL